MILFIFHKPYNLNIINNIKRHNCDLARSWHQKNTSHFMCCKTFTSSVLEFFSEADWGRDPQRQQTFQRLNKSCKVVVSEVVRLMICFGCVSVQCGWPEKMFIIQCGGVLYIYIPRNSSGKYFCRRHNFKMKSPDVVNSALSH